jgi:hypothetical protein|tara:strand:- start:1403 stop:1888 length:486 start_codon:yes stop_codon:yes gene_type:complete
VIIKYIVCSFLFFVFSCNNIEFIHKNNNQTNPLREKTVLLTNKNTEERFIRGLYSYFGNSEKNEYILKTTFLEKKENRIVKNNQVAEKIEYTLEANYDLFYKTVECKIYNKTVISKFSFTPKSSGYNFGSDKSFDKLYSNSVDQNINNFIETLQINKNCLK